MWHFILPFTKGNDLTAPCLSFPVGKKGITAYSMDLLQRSNEQTGRRVPGAHCHRLSLSLSRSRFFQEPWGENCWSLSLRVTEHLLLFKILFSRQVFVLSDRTVIFAGTECFKSWCSETQPTHGKHPPWPFPCSKSLTPGCPLPGLDPRRLR